MSRRHLFNSPDGLVNKALRGIVASSPGLNLDEANRVVYDTAYDRRCVSLVSGGGSGHEPAWSGYVGANMLAAAVQGDIFASPSAQQIVTAVDAVPSDRGTLLVIGNYTGDCLHFGLASEKARARGHRCRVLICGDDVSVGRTKGALVGRRGLAGQIAILKVLGAAAAAGAELDAVYDLGAALAAQTVSMAASLDHCHVPGRAEHGALAADEVELGTGPHNEPGHERLAPAPAAPELVAKVLARCLDADDAERGYVRFAAADETLLLVNNFGGLSNLELSALVDELLEQLHRDWHIEPARVVAGCLETSLNAPAFSVSLINVTAAAAGCRYEPAEVMGFFDARTSTQWEAAAGAHAGGCRRRRAEKFVQLPLPEHRDVDAARDVTVDPAVLERMLRGACGRLVAAEPDLTRWDTVMGDGDCGETLRSGALSLLAALDAGLARPGSVGRVLRELEEVAEGKMGGTLGGILGIFFVSLRAAVEERATQLAASVAAPDVHWGEAVLAALDSLRRYTPAREGDRTVMDTLIPFARATSKAGFTAGVKAAVEGAEATRTLKPRLGRATYVAAADGELPPDPGAWGAMEAIRGLHEGM